MDQNHVPIDGNLGGGRRNQACQRCWKRKQKCDRVLPICSGCAVVGAECRGRTTDMSSLPEDGGLTHASLSSYIDSLRGNIDEFEYSTRCKRARSNTVGSTMHVHDNGGGSVTDKRVSPSIQGLYATELHDEGDGDGSVRATMGEIGFLSRSAMAEPRNDLTGVITVQLSFEKMVFAAIAMKGSDPSSSASSTSNPQLLNIRDTNNQTIKITRETTSSYVGLFLDQALILLPYLTREQVIKDYEEVIVDHECGRVSQSEMSIPCRYFRVYMVISLGILLSQESHTLDSVHVNLHSAAMRLFTRIVMEGNDLATLDCMLTLIVYSTFSVHGGSAWHLVGLAIKKCIAARLHKEVDVQSESSHDEIDEARKLFWSCYIADRTISSVLGRPFAIQDEDISALMPGNETRNNGDPTPSQSLVFQHLVMQAKLISNIRDCTESSLFHYGNLSFWREASQNLNRNTTVSSRHFYHHLDQLTCRTFTQIVLSEENTHTYSDPVLGRGRTIIEEVVASVLRFISQTYELSDGGNFAWSFIHAYDIFSAGIVFVGSWLSLRDRISQSVGQLTKFVSKCTSLLTVISQRFSSVRQLRRVLDALLTWALEGEASTQQSFAAEYQLLLHPPTIVPNNIRQFIQQVLRETPPEVQSTSVTRHQYVMT